MRAVSQDRFGGPEVLHLVDLPKPEPLPTEILVRVHTAGVNPVDAKTRAGQGMAAVLGEPPFVLGWDVSGVVEAIGSGVNRFKVGDEVFGMPWFPRQAGAYSEYVTAPSRHFGHKPRLIDHAHAGVVPLAGLTAWQLVNDVAVVTPRQRILIHAGAGGVGHIAVQLAKSRGATVITTASEANADFVRGLGADDVIDYRTRRFEDEIDELVDTVIDLVGEGIDSTTSRSLTRVRPGGLVIAVPSGAAQDLREAGAADGIRVTDFLVEPDGDALESISQQIDAHELTVELTSTFALEDVRAAHELADHRSGRGKIGLTVVA